MVGMKATMAVAAEHLRLQTPLPWPGCALGCTSHEGWCAFLGSYVFMIMSYFGGAQKIWCWHLMTTQANRGVCLLLSLVVQTLSSHGNQKSAIWINHIFFGGRWWPNQHSKSNAGRAFPRLAVSWPCQFFGDQDVQVPDLPLLCDYFTRHSTGIPCSSWSPGRRTLTGVW